MDYKKKAINKRRRVDIKLLLFIAPSLLGMSIFYFIPFFSSMRHALFESGRGMVFIGLRNFVDIFGNPIFIQALKNTFVFLAICVPLNVVVSFLLASGIQNVSRGKIFFAMAIAFPLVIPSGTVVYFWRKLFSIEGFLNSFLLLFGHMPRNWFESAYALPIAIFVFLWKNLGFNTIIYSAGFSLIPVEYYETAKVYGANRIQTFRHVTFIYLMPTTFLVLLMSIINSFKNFREVYMLFGLIPPRGIYMLQHFITAQFIHLNLPALTVSAAVFAAAIIALSLNLFMIQKRLSGLIS